MPERPESAAKPTFQLCLDDADLCPRGPVPVSVSSLSGTGLAVLTVDQAALLNPSDLLQHGNEGRPLRLTAHIGHHSISLTAQLVWSDPSSAGGDLLDLIIDATGTPDWSTIVAAYHGAA